MIETYLKCISDSFYLLYDFTVSDILSTINVLDFNHGRKPITIYETYFKNHFEVNEIILQLKVNISYTERNDFFFFLSSLYSHTVQRLRHYAFIRTTFKSATTWNRLVRLSSTAAVSRGRLFHKT